MSAPNLLRLLGIALFAVQLIAFEQKVLFSDAVPGGSAIAAVIALAGAIVYLAAMAFCAGSSRYPGRKMGVAHLIIAVLLTVRLYVPTLLHRQHLAEKRSTPRLAAQEAPVLVSFLRNLSAAQEQYRLRSGSYAQSIDSLRLFVRVPAGSQVDLRARGDRSWAATASLNGHRCAIWTRDSSLRAKPSDPEGSPTCGAKEERLPREVIPSVVVSAPEILRPFTARDLGGSWLQHRGDAHRSGVLTSTTSVRVAWDTRVGGSLRSSVSIAGNQVFVGAHGNGELVGLTLDSGRIGFRIRAPNWIHHEPAITDDLIIVGFGNNELTWTSRNVGTAPSGVVAYDRLSGMERWRQYTAASVMTVPVIRDSIVAVATAGAGPVAFRLRDGTPLWNPATAQFTPMGNSLLLEDKMVFGVEPTSECAISIIDGRNVYCSLLFDCMSSMPLGPADSLRIAWCSGAGLASPAVAGDLVLQVIELNFHRKSYSRDLLHLLKRVVGIHQEVRAPDVREQILVAIDARHGNVRWRTSLGRGTNVPAGHIAGTPTVQNGIAYIPAANNGDVVAVNAATGKLVWSTAVKASRGSVTIVRGLVLAGTVDGSFVALDQATGRIVCSQKLPAVPDRAAITVAGSTGILTLRNGLIMARPLSDWIACRA